MKGFTAKGYKLNLVALFCYMTQATSAKKLLPLKEQQISSALEMMMPQKRVVVDSTATKKKCGRWITTLTLVNVVVAEWWHIYVRVEFTHLLLWVQPDLT
jgi:hypothetical protein